MSVTICHDPFSGAMPERDFTCSECGIVHTYRRLWDDIPHEKSPCCGKPLLRVHVAVPIQMTTPTHKIRRKILNEERAGKRERQDRTVDKSILKI